MAEDELLRLREENAKCWERIADLERQVGSYAERVGAYAERIVHLENSIESLTLSVGAMLTEWREGVLRSSPVRAAPPSTS